MTGVASFILLANIGDQRLRALHLNFEGGDQRILRINDDVSRFSLNFKADRKLHLRSPLSTFPRRLRAEMTLPPISVTAVEAASR